MQVSLPIYVRAEVFPLAANTECILVATCNRRKYGQGGDGLTAYGSVDRSDFDFRTEVFNGFPANVTRHDRRTKLRPNVWNEMSLLLSDREVTYWINGTRVASMPFSRSRLPETDLHVGFVSYSTPYRIRGFDVSRDPRVLKLMYSNEDLCGLSLFRERVFTLQGSLLPDRDCLSLWCMNIAGEEVARFDAVPAGTLLREFRTMLADQLRMTEFDIARLVLSNGDLLSDDENGKQLHLLIQ